MLHHVLFASLRSFGLAALCFVVACGKASAPDDDTTSVCDESEALATALAETEACEGNLESTDASLVECEASLETTGADLTASETQTTACESDLATSDASLETCSADLVLSQSDLAALEAETTACESDLATSDASLETCSADLVLSQNDLAATQADLVGCAEDLGLSEADLEATQTELDDLTAAVDAAAVFDQGLVDLLSADPTRAWSGWAAFGITDPDEHSRWVLYFLPDGTLVGVHDWWYSTTSLQPTEITPFSGTWSVSGSVVTVVSPATGTARYTYAKGVGLAFTGVPFGRGGVLQREAASTLTIKDTDQATQTGAWGACPASNYYGDDCLADDGSGGTNPMSITWSTRLDYGQVTPFARGLWAGTAATNGTYTSPSGARVDDQSVEGPIWVALPTFNSEPNTDYDVTLSNAGADGVVMADTVLWMRRPF